MGAIRVLIADDHPLFRECVAVSLAEAGPFTIVGEAGTADEAVSLALTTAPDIVLLDLSMRGGGLFALSRIGTHDNAPRVAMLTVSEYEDDVMQALESGAAGYVLKGVGSQELCQIVLDLAEGRSYVAPFLAAGILAAMRRPDRSRSPAGPIASLTKREEDMLNLVSRGMSNREIGAALEIQEKTVKHYITAILRKLQVRNRTEAAILAHDHWHTRPLHS